jgi:hypothetical protein
LQRMHQATCRRRHKVAMGVVAVVRGKMGLPEWAATTHPWTVLRDLEDLAVPVTQEKAMGKQGRLARLVQAVRMHL